MTSINAKIDNIIDSLQHLPERSSDIGKTELDGKVSALFEQINRNDSLPADLKESTEGFRNSFVRMSAQNLVDNRARLIESLKDISNKFITASEISSEEDIQFLQKALPTGVLGVVHNYTGLAFLRRIFNGEQVPENPDPATQAQLFEKFITANPTIAAEQLISYIRSETDRSRLESTIQAIIAYLPFNEEVAFELLQSPIVSESALRNFLGTVPKETGFDNIRNLMLTFVNHLAATPLTSLAAETRLNRMNLLIDQMKLTQFQVTNPGEMEEWFNQIIMKLFTESMLNPSMTPALIRIYQEISSNLPTPAPTTISIGSLLQIEGLRPSASIEDFIEQIERSRLEGNPYVPNKENLITLIRALGKAGVIEPDR